MKVINFKAEHLDMIDVQPGQIELLNNRGAGYYGSLLEKHDAWTGMIDDKVVACVGLVPVWPKRYQAWALISGTIGPVGMLQLSRAVRRGMSLIPGRIELVADASFAPGCRWAEILGFKRETPEPMPGWFENGAAAIQYARVS